MSGPSPVPAPPDAEVDLDGRRIPARRDQTVAGALLAAGVSVFARSVKYHRPRGPFCFAGRCSNCLMRVDGVPNVATCRAPVGTGRRVSVQNVVGSARVDLLGTIDWLFPRGLDHHAMFAGVPVVEKAVAVVARHLAGLGTLPDAPARPLLPAAQWSADVAVVGAGPAGLAFAAAAAEAGRSVLVLDEEISPGGLAGWSADGVRPPRGAELRPACAVAGFYRDGRGPFLLAASAGPEPRVARVTARAFGWCTGGQEALWAFPGNDVPGVVAGRGAARFAARERVTIGRRAVVLAAHPDAAAVAQTLAAAGVEVAAVLDLSGGLVADGFAVERAQAIEAVEGRSRVRSLIWSHGSARHAIPCDTVALCGPASPAFELASQAGCARVPHPASGGFAVRVGDDGSTSVPGVFAAGHVAGAGDAASAAAQGARAGRAAANYAARA